MWLLLPIACVAPETPSDSAPTSATSDVHAPGCDAVADPMVIADAEMAWDVGGLGMSPGMWILFSGNLFTMFDTYAWKYPSQTCMQIDDEGFVADCFGPDGWELHGEMSWLSDTVMGQSGASFAEVSGALPATEDWEGWEVHADGHWMSTSDGTSFAADLSWAGFGYLANWPGSFTAQSNPAGPFSGRWQVGSVTATDAEEYPTGTACFAEETRVEGATSTRATLLADALWELEWVDGCLTAVRDGVEVASCDEG